MTAEVDDPGLAELREESEDLHADAMRAAAGSRPEFTEIGEARGDDVDTDEIDRFNQARRRLLARIGHDAGGLAARTLLGGGLFAGLLAGPARADTALDVQILQTASSLEALAVATYTAALGEGPEGPDAPAAKALAGISAPRAKATVTAFAHETRRQHAEHRKAFQAQTGALGGRIQDAPNPRFLAMVSGADLSAATKLVELAATLEKVATDTYLLNLSMLEDGRAKEIMAAVMAVESQHLATLRTVSALLAGGVPELVAVPFPLGDMLKLPAGVGNVATPDAFHQVSGPELIAEPASGAVT